MQKARDTADSITGLVVTVALLASIWWRERVFEVLSIYLAINIPILIVLVALSLFGISKLFASKYFFGSAMLYLLQDFLIVRNLTEDSVNPFSIVMNFCRNIGLTDCVHFATVTAIASACFFYSEYLSDRLKADALVANPSRVKLRKVLVGLCICLTFAAFTLVGLKMPSRVAEHQTSGGTRQLQDAERIYKATGVSGLRESSEKCYLNLAADPKLDSLKSCALIDMFSSAVDRQSSSDFKTPLEHYFDPIEFQKRLGPFLLKRKVKLDEANEFIAELEKQLNEYNKSRTTN